jgi:rRNA-processing protein FCF1
MYIKMNYKEKCLVNTKTGEIIRPDCIQDLMQYHAYLIATGDDELAKQVLKNVAKGERVISDMLAASQTAYMEQTKKKHGR